LVRILLVRPNFEIRQLYPPLGLAYIAAWLRKQNAGYKIKVVDGLVEKLSYEDFREIFFEFKPNILGITSMDLCSGQTHEIAKLAKKINRNCSVVVGGPYSTGDPEAVVTDGNVDFAVVGEGEKAIEKLVEAIITGNDPSYIKGIAYKKNGKFILNQVPEYLHDIDAIPFPAWDLVGLGEYFVFNKVPVPIITTRGCPYNCIYCLDTFGKRVRFRSIENMLQELKLLVNKYKVNHIAIMDDIFNIDQKRVIEFCDNVISNKLNINIFIGYGLKIEFMNKQIISKLKEAGVYYVTYGIEPLSKRIQQLTRRHFNPTHARHIIDFSVQKGLFTEGTVGIGAPSETEEEIMKTIRYVKSTKLHRVDFSCISSFFPKIKLRKLSQMKSIFNSNRLANNMNFLSDKKLKKIKKKAYIEFYLNPIRIWRIFSTSKYKSKLVENLFFFFKYMFSKV